MVQVLEKNLGAKQCTCSSCSSRLRYSITEIKEDYSTDWTGGRDYYNYIMCPACNYKIRLGK